MEGAFDKIEFSDNKDTIEEYFVSRFIESEEAKFGKYFFISNSVKNKLDDFDFSVTTPKGQAYLELMEIAPLENHKGGHEEASDSYDIYDLSKYIFSKIESKSRKYPNNLTNELFLLLYVTNYKFCLDDTTSKLLQYFCLSGELKFDVIFMYTPLDETAGNVNWIFPTDEDSFKNFNPDYYRGTVLNLNLSKCKVIT